MTNAERNTFVNLVLADAAQRVIDELNSGEYIRRSLFIHDNTMREMKPDERFLNDIVTNTKRLEKIGDEEETNLAYAQIFAETVANSLVVTDMFDQQLDVLFEHSKYKEYLEDLDLEEKYGLREELKHDIAQKLAVTPETEEGKQLAGELSQIFREAISASYDDEFSDRPSARAAFMRDVMLPTEIITGNQLNGKAVFTEDIALAFQNGQPATKAVSAALRDHAQQLGTERKVFEPIISRIIINDATVSPAEFVGHFSDFNSLSEHEKDWADCVFEGAMRDVSMEITGDSPNLKPDFANFKLNGKMMFTGEEILGADPDKLKTRIIGHMILGNEVTYADPERGKEVLLSPDFQRAEELSFFRRLMNFIRELLGMEPEDELESMREEAMQQEEKFMNNANARREKVSFNELAGLDAANKAVTPRVNEFFELEHNIEKSIK